MKRVRSLLIVAVLGACLADDRLLAPASSADPVVPITPPVSPPAPNVGASIRIMVIDASGACITGASVRVIRGQSVGQNVTQDQPCSVWDYGYDGAVLKDLTKGVEMTVVVSAPGYVARELTVVPTSAHEVELIPNPR